MLLCVFSVKTFAWYPDYSVMATDFVIPGDYLQPARITSIRQLALGPHFQYLYLEPIDEVFRNSASLREISNQYFYLDVAGNQKNSSKHYGIAPDISYRMAMPYYWSPYREFTEPKPREPLFRMAYLGKVLGKTSPLSLGITLEYFYDQQRFYQPIWYWYGYNTREDALGNTLRESPDPYDDYRQAEAGDNVLINRGLSANGLVAYSVSPGISVGFKYGVFVRNADGNYLNLDRHDDYDWADEYLDYSKDAQIQKQDQFTHDFSGGLLRLFDDGSNFGVNVGFIFGNLTRDYTSTDSTHYYYYRSMGPESYQYSRSFDHGRSRDDKNWDYEGKTIYATLHGKRIINEDVIVRATVFGEKLHANLNESETMWRHSYYQYYYWSEYDNSAYRYENYSSTDLNRSGTGSYKFTHLTGSVGTEWRLTSTIRFIGGLYVDYRTDHKTANEPFLGEKHSEYERSLYNPGFNSITQIDDKRFHWYRNESYTTFAVPTGLIIEVGNAVEFQFGLAKVLQAIETNEGYDLVVYHDKEVRVIDNSTTVQSDSSYVEGHSFPGTNNFVEEYQMNAGITLKYKENFRISAALRESIVDPREFKIGAELIF